jgi:hypothetical protein
MNAALAQDERLHALAEGFTYKGPFFETDGGQGSKEVKGYW